MLLDNGVGKSYRQTVKIKLSFFLIGLVSALSVQCSRGHQDPAPQIATEADFRKAMKELSNWGRWGEKDELGAANLITPAKRKQALSLAREGVTVSLSHDVPQEKAADTP